MDLQAGMIRHCEKQPRRNLSLVAPGLVAACGGSDSSSQPTGKHPSGGTAGYGKNTNGARGGDVHEVTNPNERYKPGPGNESAVRAEIANPSARSASDEGGWWGLHLFAVLGMLVGSSCDVYQLPPTDQGAGGANTASKALLPLSSVAISEIMYHPFNDTYLEDEHEFVELHNISSEAVSVAGWRLYVGETERFIVPNGTNIGPVGYLVVARNRERLLAVSAYSLDPQFVVGDYSGGLDNEGGRIAVVDGQGNLQDAVEYDNEAPWPVSADALSAKDDECPAEGDTGDSHQFMGRSLERYNFSLPSSSPHSWEASPVDGATPGRANSVNGEAKVIVLDTVALSRSSGSATITAGDPVRLTALLSAGFVTDVAVEYRVDLGVAARPKVTTRPMTLVSGSTTSYEIALPSVPANSVVRYRILGSRGGPLREQIGPRLTDPHQFYEFFVLPTVATERSAQHSEVNGNWMRS